MQSIHDNGSLVPRTKCNTFSESREWMTMVSDPESKRFHICQDLSSWFQIETPSVLPNKLQKLALLKALT